MFCLQGRGELGASCRPQFACGTRSASDKDVDGDPVDTCAAQVPAKLTISSPHSDPAIESTPVSCIAPAHVTHTLQMQATVSI
jgi:hypothetical protein